MAAKKKATKKPAIARRKRPSAGVTKVVTTVETEQKGVMSRQDIADYLGLTIETVSRTFTQLEQTGAIALPSSRRVELCNRTALARLAA